MEVLYFCLTKSMESMVRIKMYRAMVRYVSTERMKS